MSSAGDGVLTFGVNVEQLPRKGRTVVIEPAPDELERLAAAHGLQSVDGFRAELLVAPWRGDGVRVSGRLDADVTQTCVVTLDPVENHVGEQVEVLLLPERSKLGRRREGEGGELLIDPEGDDMPETFGGNTVDVGALAEEFFELALDPYPRKPGAELPDARQRDDGQEEPASSAFAKLAQIRKPR